MWPLQDYFANHLSRQVKELYLSTAILNLATAMIMIFEPLYLYKIGFTVQQIVLFFLAVYVIYFFALPLGGMFSRAHGYERGILASTPLSVLYYLSLFAIPYHQIFIALAIIFLVAEKTFYWPGYHADFARFGVAIERGKQIAWLSTLGSFVYVIGPLIGGAILHYFSFPVLFIVVSLITLCSNIPLLTTKEVFTAVPFSYGRAILRVFRQENRRRLFVYMGFGEELIAGAVWPILIFLIVKDYFRIGGIVAGTIFLTAIAVLYIGRVTDKAGRRGLIRGGVVFTALSWLFRALVTTAGGVFLVDTIYRIARNMVGVPLLAFTYDYAQKASVMKTIIFFEMALVLGKIITAVLVLILLSFNWGWWGIFGIAALISLLYSLLPVEDKEAIKNGGS